MSGRRRGEFEPLPPRQRLEIEDYDPYEAFVGYVPQMINIARKSANDNAVSYREFHVGAALFAVTFDCKTTTILGGANYKPRRSSRKYCAEMDVIDQAEEMGLEHAIGIVIAGPEDPEQIKSVMGHVAPTLHPCSACRVKMTNSKLFTDDTIVMTVGKETDRAQVYGFDDLRVLYDVGTGPETSLVSPAVELDLNNWHRNQYFYDQAVNQSNNADPSRVARLALSTTIELNQ